MLVGNSVDGFALTWGGNVNSFLFYAALIVASLINGWVAVGFVLLSFAAICFGYNSAKDMICKVLDRDRIDG